ncbi:hypothetical protein EDB92DRAFT_579276 [Lactarius akahatsu]|uniref:Uncharacterized protein n=1 Tax=Lactarius akahatsu TaxID=416441 RepID=A0AAD4LGK6_9AGAM|nr:hypothetical protein EDB92DRAFT_579276 [Lactarius akahatsu]
MDPSPLKSSKKSLFSRKPVKRSSTDASSPLSTSPPDRSSTHDTPAEPVPVSREPSSDTSSSNRNRSIIPESLKELPSWYHTEGEWAAASALQFRARYPIHNPVGPRVYRNVHLLPPTRPSSVFSPSFPPMSTEPASAPPVAVPSQSPSGSPIPTPNSSQTRIIDPSGKVRTRKISNTAHDNVDLLDASDPYGTNWHHQSPYDGLGLSSDRTAVSPDPVDSRPPPRSRSRMSSLGAGSHHKTTTPSPLSQSTSAVHLTSDQDTPPITRKLTKRRRPFDGIFGLSPTNPPDSASSTPSSLSPSTHTVTNRLFKRQSIFKSASTSSIPHTVSNASIEKRQKRGSMLGRFARRFSIMRRVTRGHSRGGSLDASNDWSRGDTQSLQVTDNASTVTRPASMSNPVSPSEKRQSTRVPPPRAQTTPSPDSSPPLETPEEEQTQDDVEMRDASRDSMSSLQVPYSIGRLTIANPDSPGSTDNSPVNQSYTLPAGKTPAQSPTPIIQSGPLVESPSILTPPFKGFASVPLASPSLPMMRVTLVDEGPKSPPFSAPIPIPRAPPKSDKHTPLSSSSSSTPIPTSPTPSPPTHPSTTKVTASLPPTVDDSPLSRASIIVNPPTPSVEPTRMKNPSANEQAKVPPAVHLSIPSPIITPIGPTSPRATSPHESHKPSSRDSSPVKNQGSRQPKTTSSVRTRETETFHLVRSPSVGTMQPTGESIIVGGEQWEVVGRGTQRSKTKKEKDDVRRSHVEPDRRASKRQERTAEKVTSSGPSKSESRKSRTKEGTSSRRYSSQTAESKEHVRRSATTPSTRTSGVPASAAAPTAAAAPERRPSQSQGRRPTSELSPAADMNAVRAREVWEMDRLWKGRSMAYGLEGPHVVYAQSIGDVSSTTSVNGIGHGSTHTSYKLQQGFPFPTTATATTAPGIYSSSPPHTQQQQQQQPQQQMMPSLYEFPSGVRSYPDLANIPSIGTPDSTPSLPSRNPLPAPPRQSTYRPGPIPASFVERDDGTAAEYWSKYAGVGVVSPTH